LTGSPTILITPSEKARSNYCSGLQIKIIYSPGQVPHKLYLKEKLNFASNFTAVFLLSIMKKRKEKDLGQANFVN